MGDSKAPVKQHLCPWINPGQSWKKEETVQTNLILTPSQGSQHSSSLIHGYGWQGPFNGPNVSFQTSSDGRTHRPQLLCKSNHKLLRILIPPLPHLPLTAPPSQCEVRLSKIDFRDCQTVLSIWIVLIHLVKCKLMSLEVQHITYWYVRLGIVWILSIPILLTDFRFPVSIPMWLNNDIKHPVSLFCKPFIGDEYHEQKSTGYIKTGLFKSCLCAK